MGASKAGREIKVDDERGETQKNGKRDRIRTQILLHTHSHTLTHTHTLSHGHTHTHTSRVLTGGGVEVRTDHFGIKAAAAADMKSSNKLVRRLAEFFQTAELSLQLSDTHTHTHIVLKTERSSADEDL